MRDTLIGVAVALAVVVVFTILVKACVPHEYVPGVKVTVEEDDRFEATADQDEALGELRDLKLQLQEIRDLDAEMDEIFDGLRHYQELLEADMRGELWSA